MGFKGSPLSNTLVLLHNLIAFSWRYGKVKTYLVLAQIQLQHSWFYMWNT